MYDLNLGSIAEFDAPVTMITQNLPAPASAGFAPNPVPALPGSSQLTVSNTAGLGDADITFQAEGSAASADDRSIDLNLLSFADVPPLPSLSSPANGSDNVEFRPAFAWNAVNAVDSTLELATDPDFNNIVFTTTVASETTAIGFDLASSTQYFWRVRSNNACGLSQDSQIFTFTTQPAPGDCNDGLAPNIQFFDDIENGDNGWTSSGTQNSWQRSGLETSSGDFAWFAEDLDSISDQLLVSPPVQLPVGELPMVLSFQNSQTIEDDAPDACWDAAILEISTDDGVNWTQINDADLLTDPYDGTVNNFTGGPNPLAGLQAWCADPEDFVRSIVDLVGFSGRNRALPLSHGH